MENANNDNKQVYQVKMTANQLFLLEHTCEWYMRLLCGQDFILRDFLENRWHKFVQEKKNLEYTGPEFWEMRKLVEQYVSELRDLIWDIRGNADYGIGVDKDADNLWDIYQVLRHQRYLDMDDESKDMMRNTVMSHSAMHTGTEPLITVENISNKKPE